MHGVGRPSNFVSCGSVAAVVTRFLIELPSSGQLALALICSVGGCSFLAPSDEELVGGGASGDAAEVEPGEPADVDVDESVSAADDTRDGQEPGDDEGGGAVDAGADVSRSEGGARADGGARPDGGDAGPRADGGDSGLRADGGDAGLRADGGDAGPRPDAGPVACPAVADCSIPACETKQCGSAETQRCCSRACVDTASDPRNCQGCGLACAAGQSCMLIVDVSGRRGHCTCLGTGDCPKQPAQICRAGNGDGEDGLCACDFVNVGNAGCATGQTCADVPAANFCHY